MIVLLIVENVVNLLTPVLVVMNQDTYKVPPVLSLHVTMEDIQKIVIDHVLLVTILV